MTDNESPPPVYLTGDRYVSCEPLVSPRTLPRDDDYEGGVDGAARGLDEWAAARDDAPAYSSVAVCDDVGLPGSECAWDTFFLVPKEAELRIVEHPGRRGDFTFRGHDGVAYTARFRTLDITSYGDLESANDIRFVHGEWDKSTRPLKVARLGHIRVLHCFD